MITRRLLILVRRHRSLIAIATAPGFDDLTVDDHAVGQASLPDPLEHDLAAADRHLGRAYRGGADVESDDLSGHVVRLPCCAWVRAPGAPDEASAVKVIDPPKCDLEKVAAAGSRP